MPAKRGKNFRSGDLAEQLGLYLIQSVALVAPVPRTEDVGIDIVATLITDYDSYSYIAEDSFYVQIKSSNIECIEYDKDEIGWLSSLKLPFFIASIDKDTSKIRLYSCRRMYDAFALEKDREKLTLTMDTEEAFKVCDFVDKDNDEVLIGPPIFEWSVSDLMKNEVEVRKSFYKIIKEHVRIIHECMELYELGCGSTYVWKTNEMPEHVGWKSCNSSHVDFDKVSGKMMAYLCKTLDLCLQLGSDDIFSDVESIITDYKKMYSMLEGIRSSRSDEK